MSEKVSDSCISLCQTGENMMQVYLQQTTAELYLENSAYILTLIPASELDWALL